MWHLLWQHQVKYDIECNKPIRKYIMLGWYQLQCQCHIIVYIGISAHYISFCYNFDRIIVSYCRSATFIIHALKRFVTFNVYSFSYTNDIWQNRGHQRADKYPTTLGNTCHYSDVLMSAMASQTTGVSIVCSAVCSGADQSKYQNFVSLAFVRGIHRTSNADNVSIWGYHHEFGR